MTKYERKTYRHQYYSEPGIYELDAADRRERLNLENLHEVVDSWDRPLCLMGEEAILQQSLLHRSVHVLALDHSGRMLLKCSGSFSFTVSGIPPAGIAAGDFLQKLLLSIGLPHSRHGAEQIWEPRPENSYSFARVFTIYIAGQDAARVAGKDFLLVEANEIRALIARGHSFSPFFSLFLAKQAICPTAEVQEPAGEHGCWQPEESAQS